MKKLILAGALLLAAPGAQAQGTSSNPTNRPVQAPSVTGGTADQHQQFNPTNTQPTSTNTSGNAGAARVVLGNLVITEDGMLRIAMGK